MGIFKKSTDKLENNLALMAVLICVIGILMIILGFCYTSIVGTADNGDNIGNGDTGASNGGGNTVKNYYGTYVTENYSDEEGVEQYAQIVINQNGCTVTFILEVDGEKAEDERTFTCSYLTSNLVQRIICYPNFANYNAIMLSDNGSYFTALWIINEQAGNYQFALVLNGDTEIIFK